MRGLRGRTALIAGAVALIVASCAPGDSDDADPAEADPTEPADETEPAVPDEEITLVVWDQEVRGGQNEVIEELNAEFQEAHPNITIERVSRSFEDLETTLPLALTGDDAPDVVQANNGRPMMGAFVEAGLLLPLDDYAEQYGWTERFPDSVRATASYTPDGVTFGEGSLYGLAQQGELVGVFYNRAKLDDLGLAVPETWEDFLAAIEAANAAGEVAMPFGNVDQWPGIHVYGAVMNRHVPADDVRHLGFGTAGADWTSAENMAAADEILDLAEAGLFSDGFNGADYDVVAEEFGAGTGVFLIAGTWLLPDLDEALGDDLGFMLPPPQAGETNVATGATSLPFSITSATEHPDAAAVYLDFLTTADAMQLVAEKGLFPAVDAGSQPTQSAAQAEVFGAWETVTAENGVVPYLDWATPTFYDTIAPAIQELVGGQLEPEPFLQRLQDDYAGFVGG
jgi:raffinose/stachyose/melibiose transport system substrate-binding protein